MPAAGANSFWYYLKKAWQGHLAAWSIFLALVLFVVAVAWAAPSNVDLKVCLIVLTALLWLIVLLLQLVAVLYDAAEPPPTRVRAGKKLASTSPDGKGVLLVESSYNLTLDTTVGIYFIDEDSFEGLVAYGRVYHIQQDGFVQLEVLQVVPACNEVMNKILENDATAISRVRIRVGAKVLTQSQAESQEKLMAEAGPEATL